MTTKNEDKYHMNLSNWPHLFTKVGKPLQVDEDPETHDPLFAVEMVCTRCQIKYLNGIESRPPDPCPARNEKIELKRLLG